MKQKDKTPYANWYPHPIQNATESSFTNTNKTCRMFGRTLEKMQCHMSRLKT